MIVMKKYLSQIILLMMFIPVFAQEKSNSGSGDVKVLNASNFTAETAKGVVWWIFGQHGVLHVGRCLRLSMK